MNSISFVLLSFLFGLPLIVLIPPFQVADEEAHFLRAWQISEGTLIGMRIVDISGGELPTSLKHFSLLGYQRNKKFFEIELNENRELFHFGNAVMYSPVVYIPQALGIWMGRHFSKKISISFYMGRLFNLVGSILILTWVLSIIPFFKSSLFIFAFMPMALFQRSSFSCDALTLSLVFLYIGLLFKLKYSNLVTKQNLVIGVFLSILVCLSKQAYFALPFLTLIFNLREKKYLYFALSSISLGLGSILIWSYFCKDLYTPGVFGNELGPQIYHYLKNPVSVSWTIITYLVSNFLPLYKQMIGVLGWLDALLPSWFYMLWSIVTLFVLLIEAPDKKNNLFTRFYCLLIFLFSIYLIALLVYLHGAPVGAKQLYGVQGRYLLPLLPLSFFFLKKINYFNLFSRIKNSLALCLAIISGIILNWELWVRYFSSHNGTP